MRIQAYIRHVTYDQRGRVIKQSRWRKAQSFVRQWIEILTVQFSQATQQIYDDGYTLCTVGPSSHNLRLEAGPGITYYGILVGSGTTPVDINDYHLESQITTNLDHNETTFTLSSPDANSRQIDITRNFSNIGTTDISVTEVVLQCRAYALSLGIRSFCLDRSLYSLTIPALGSVDLTYRLRVTV